MAESLTAAVFDALARSVAERVAPRKITGILAMPRLRRDLSVDSWFLYGVVMEPCALADRGRL